MSASASCPLDVDEIVLLSTEDLPRTPQNNFYKQLRFSPDGMRILASTENNYLMSWDVDVTLVNNTKYYCNVGDADIDELKGVKGVKGGEKGADSGGVTSSSCSAISCGESIYDFDWYPFMNSQDPLTCCFITTCRDHPIHLYDSTLGTIRCSYSCYNAVDEVEAANCVTFNLTGDKIYAGSKSMIRAFDVNNPGRTCVSKPTCKSRKDTDGQRGIISCIKFNPDFSGAYAAGSYAHNITIYAENVRESVLELGGLEFGVTCMKWSPCGNMLWAGGRSHSDLICWDLRTTRSEVGRVPRPLDSNQRMFFDLDPWGKYLATGTQEGKILLYDTQTFELHATLGNTGKGGRGGDGGSGSMGVGTTGSRTWQTDGQTDGRTDDFSCVNAVAFHPYCAVLISTTGERHFDYDGEDDSDSDDDNTDSSHTSAATATAAAVSNQSTSAAATATVSEGSININNNGNNNSNINDSNDDHINKKKRLSPPPPPCKSSGLQVWAIGRVPIILPIVRVENVDIDVSIVADTVHRVNGVQEVKEEIILMEIAPSVQSAELAFSLVAATIVPSSSSSSSLLSAAAAAAITAGTVKAEAVTVVGRFLTAKVKAEAVVLPISTSEGGVPASSSSSSSSSLLSSSSSSSALSATTATATHNPTAETPPSPISTTTTPRTTPRIMTGEQTRMCSVIDAVVKEATEGIRESFERSIQTLQDRLKAMEQEARNMYSK